MRQFKKVGCNNCKSKKFKLFLDRLTTWEHEGVFQIVKCVECGLVFLNPRPQKSDIGKYYPKESYWGEDKLKVRGDQYGFIYQRIFTVKKSGRVLDIGAGTGVFLSKFKELGWEVHGIELLNDAVAIANSRYGIVLKRGDFLDFQFPENYFDLVTLNNSLEHVYEPRETLERVSPILKNDGMLLITVPNIEGLGFLIFGKNWYPLQPPRHLYHFSLKTVSSMLKDAGFKVDSIAHSYFVHNYYSLFESFRMRFSPRFRKREKGGLVEKKYKKKASILFKAGKLFGRAFAFVIAHLGSLAQRGEVIVVYAKKKT